MRIHLLFILLQLLVLVGYCQPDFNRKRGFIKFKDSTEWRGWITDPEMHKTPAPDSVVFYDDSSHGIGKKFDARQADYFEIIGGARYVSASFSYYCDKSKHKPTTTEDGDFKTFFCKAVVSGVYNLLSVWDNDHTDYFIRFSYKGSMIMEPLQIAPDTVAQEKVHLYYKYRLIQILQNSPFSETWIRYLSNKILHTNEYDLPNTIQDFNLAYVTSAKEQLQIAAEIESETGLSLSLGTSQGFSKLRYPDSKLRLASGVVSSLVATVEILEKIEPGFTVRLGYHYGWTHHFYDEFYFHSHDFGTSMLFSFPQTKKRFIYLGLGANFYKSTWPQKTANRMANGGLNNEMQQKWWSMNGRLGVILNKSNWDIGLIGNLFGQIDGGRFNNPTAISVYVAKHIDFPLGKWMEQFRQWLGVPYETDPNNGY